MSAAWPPPPDLASIQELVRAADPEKHLADGAPADEYEPEEQAIFTALKHMSTAELLAAEILKPIETIWSKAFNLSEEALAERRPALLSLAKEIERFFGPEASPRTRGNIVAEERGSHDIVEQMPRHTAK